ncbi:MAG TPA: polyprenyl diphosphate synthase [Candidatus Saccharimonadales bacterium]
MSHAAESSSLTIPLHIGYIVDGNRRWAKKHGIPKYEGHLAGYNALKDVVIESVEAGVKFVSVYVFSTENWKRDTDEVRYLMKLVHRLMTKDLKELIDRDIRALFIGSRAELGADIVEAIEKAEEASAHCSRGTAVVCLNYGGQREIVEATKAIIDAGVKTEQITEESFAKYLYAPEVPAVDVVVRTSGEHRLSNFMLWRAAYSEFIFIDKYWPDMRPEDVHEIIKEYNNRQRRFGN